VLLANAAVSVAVGGGGGGASDDESIGVWSHTIAITSEAAKSASASTGVDGTLPCARGEAVDNEQAGL
jgi:hypothetical protein